MIVLSGCVVKSLHPFYTKETVAYDASLVGSWEDTQKGKWTISPISDELTKEDMKDMEFPKELKSGYLIEYKQDKKVTLHFVAVPFKIKEQLFLDFTLVDIEGEESLDFALHHMVSVHTLARADKTEDGKLQVSWFAQYKIEELFEKDKIRLKHEKIGIDKETYLLTASSKELEKFITKYMDSEMAEKWETSVKFTLEKKEK